MVIIGGGPGGYTAALRARQLGLTAALVEKERIGGVCLNRGCIPTKALLADAEGVHWMARSVKEGLIDHAPPVSFSKLMGRKDSVVESLVSGLEKMVAGSGVHVIHAAAEIREPGIVRLDTGESLSAGTTILASGARSWKPPIPGIDLPGVVTSREILELDRLPEHPAIIGGGVIGQEFAAIFSAFGSQVTILEALDRVLAGVDTDLVKRYVTIMRGRGVRMETGVKIAEIVEAGDRLRIVYERKGKEKSLDADLILTATGRKPVIDYLSPEITPALTNGAVTVDDRLRTSLDGVRAIGDVTGRNMLAHVASFHGEKVAELCAGEDTVVDDSLVPACVFTTPQFAWVGLTEDEASAKGIAYRSSTFPLAASGKALALGEPLGWLKLVEDVADGRVIGAHFLGPGVSELIAELTLAIRVGATAKDITDTIHPHPTLSEAVRESALGLFDGSIHAAARVKSSNEARSGV